MYQSGEPWPSQRAKRVEPKCFVDGLQKGGNRPRPETSHPALTDNKIKIFNNFLYIALNKDYNYFLYISNIVLYIYNFIS
ncbi:hypothetical protein HZ326_29751 [Fusarium oxysporum f. sp. albedinis]|nr:hypothetical protein HZ326_29751 [Fusarium oxysporum f. sp. albedinis]